MHILKLKIPMNMVAKKNRLIPIPVPLKKGKVSLWQHKGRYVRVALIPDGKFKSFEKEVQKITLSQLPAGFKPIERPVTLQATFYYKGNEPDTSGCLESIGDALEGIVWENDKYLQRIYGDKVRDKDNPRIELSVKELL